MRNSYTEILQHKVEIPIIQRDYAQGRTDDKTNKIRKDFLDVLFEYIQKKLIKSSISELELDFIYGFNEQESKDKFSFIPIDGQQRLTTLWLLYWFVASKENVSDEERAFLFNFVYETRHSTTIFCENLIRFKPGFTSEAITNEIKNQPWYFETWDFDPSIQAMLIVLSDIEARYNHMGITSAWDLIGRTACPFYFYKLDMDKIGLTDDLYIKMNSRGKALTEFEYFKAGFSEILTNPSEKERFEKSVDQDWIDAIWNIVLEPGNLKNEDDIALIVDNCFLNLFNFITSVIAFKKDWRYKDTMVSAELLKTIYSDTMHQNILFETLDAICLQQTNNSAFWGNTFYYDKDGFQSSKSRLYFQHQEVNLLKRCLFHFGGQRGLSFPEQLILHACFTQFKTQSIDFENRIRVIRNLVVNSENELRETILSYSFEEVEQYIIHGDLNVFENFKTDQIEEEKKKEHFLKQSMTEIDLLKKLEDSDIFRGNVSLIPLDQNFGFRSEKFLTLFDEYEILSDFNNRCDLLLSFGDYSQNDGALTNLMSPTSRTVIRNFFTTPGFNKAQFYNKTQTVILDCLDYFIANLTISIDDKIKEKLVYYISNPKDWKYYFMKYHSFRKDCTRGYYWHNGDYGIWKMRVRQFNGYHWDPFLYELAHSLPPEYISLDNFGAKLLLSINGNKLLISTLPNGFLFENGMGNGTDNSVLDELINDNVICNSGELLISQNSEGVDLEDRIEKINQVLENIFSK
ncbi:hypothetical protein EZS27_010389 [termite gut metagenome]|uniref:GmrSD restriction endonucleases N-terminal domain-containing protein n=1 Tax=termite gut metagenome TaxID=433724 RepID=A0A5J4S6T9_9ZZZZ